MRDEVEKKKRGYLERKSIVRPDGSETLVGRDWKRRKLELQVRSGGQCEQIADDDTRCRSDATEPHHIKPRSRGRDDRLANLAHLCHTHHERLDWKKIRLRDLRKEQGALNRCQKHPKAAPFDGKLCPACASEKEFLALTDS